MGWSAATGTETRAATTATATSAASPAARRSARAAVMGGPPLRGGRLAPAARQAAIGRVVLVLLGVALAQAGDDDACGPRGHALERGPGGAHLVALGAARPHAEEQPVHRREDLERVGHRQHRR